jgi:hypothetical protein
VALWFVTLSFKSMNWNEIFKFFVMFRWSSWRHHSNRVSHLSVQWKYVSVRLVPRTQQSGCSGSIISFLANFAIHLRKIACTPFSFVHALKVKTVLFHSYEHERWRNWLCMWEDYWVMNLVEWKTYGCKTTENVN